MLQTGEEVIRRGLAALHSRDWTAFAALMDPEEVESFRCDELDRYARLRPRDPTLEDARKRDPAMPDAVAEYELEELRRFYNEWLPSELRRNYGVESLEELGSLSGFEMMAGHLRVTDPRVVLARVKAETPEKAASLPDDIELNWHVIGFVPEGDDLVHCVFRVIWTNRPPGGKELQRAEVATARRRTNGWTLDYDVVLGVDRVYSDLGSFVQDDEE
jgi:hypothetical protein